jgi:1-acyl-sn-glycerol-3-phosphate acyltransferase
MTRFDEDVEDPGAPTRSRLALYGGVRLALLAFAKVWFRLRVEGADRVPREGAFILAPTHRSNLDFLLVLACTRRRMRFLGKASLWRSGTSRLFHALGGIPVHRGTADREALRTCVRTIRSGERLVIFPEGARQTGPTVTELFDGPTYVQAQTGVPIVPVGVGGSEAAMPKGARFPRPRKVVVVVGEPLPAAQVEGSVARRSAVRQQSATLHEVLQQLFDEAQRSAGTPNP